MMKLDYRKGSVAMRKSEKTSFEKICDELEENYVLNKNEITYVKDYLKSKLTINRDMLLKIKAQADDTDYNIVLSLTFSMLAMFFAAISVIAQFSPKLIVIDSSISTIIYLISTVVMLFLTLKIFDRFSTVKRWRKYVLVVVNQMIYNLDQQVEKKHKKHNKKKKHK